MRSRITVKWIAEHYRKREAMVPMRDGVRLYTAIYEPAGIAGGAVGAGTQRENVPQDAQGGRPVILIRTPFPLNPYGKTFTRDLRGFMSLFAQNEYIIVYQNVRGRFMSEGEFENVRPVGQSGKSIDDATDTFDTVEWLLKNCHTNGNIGVKGMSYPGFYATVAALCGHPAIKAVSPQAPVTDWFIGDDAHINGIFQLPTYLFGVSFFRPRKGLSIRWPAPLVKTDGDLYDYFLEQGPNLLESLRDRLPFFGDILDHPTYDEFWKSRNPLNQLPDKLPAMLVVGGWFDAEDSYGAFETYRKIKAKSPATEMYLCAGPWYHGAWKKSGYEALGDLHFTSGSAEYFREAIEYPFFAKYLEGKGSGPQSKVSVLPSGETMALPYVRSRKSAANGIQRPEWRHYSQWPPEHKDLKLFLDLSNSFSMRPRSESGYFGYALHYDPQHPVPYTGETLEYFTREAFVSDQRFAARRPDVLTFRTPVLKEEMKVEGQVKLTLHLDSYTPRTDMDIIVKLIDQRPDGYQIPVRIGAKPLRFRNSMTSPTPVDSQESVKLEIELTDVAHHFRPGHRLLLHIQASMFPLLALPKTGLPEEIFLRIGQDTPSSITLPIAF